jgi:hypothetical protein
MAKFVHNVLYKNKYSCVQYPKNRQNRPFFCCFCHITKTQPEKLSVRVSFLSVFAGFLGVLLDILYLRKFLAHVEVS